LNIICHIIYSIDYIINKMSLYSIFNKMRHQVILQELIDLIGFSIGSLSVFLLFMLLFKYFVYVFQDPTPKKFIDRMKYYEEISKNINIIPNDTPYFVKLNGTAFSKLSQKYKKIAKERINGYYTKEFKNAMLLTCHDLLNEFKCESVYTLCDEIVLVFKYKQYYDLTLISSFASCSFMLHFSEELLENNISLTESIENHELVKGFNDEIANDNKKILLKERLYKKLSSPNSCESVPTFDANIIVFPKNKHLDIYQYLTYINYTKNGVFEHYISDQGIFLKQNSKKHEYTKFYKFNNLMYNEDVYKFIVEPYFDINNTFEFMVYDANNYCDLFDKQI